jgi:hypothetical protein
VELGRDGGGEQSHGARGVSTTVRVLVVAKFWWVVVYVSCTRAATGAVVLQMGMQWRDGDVTAGYMYSLRCLIETPRHRPSGCLVATATKHVMTSVAVQHRGKRQDGCSACNQHPRANASSLGQLEEVKHAQRIVHPRRRLRRAHGGMPLEYPAPAPASISTALVLALSVSRRVDMVLTPKRQEVHPGPRRSRSSRRWT